MKNNSKILGFGIEKIVTEEFAVIKDAYVPDKPLEIRHEISFGIDKENQKIYIRKSARFQHTDSGPIIIISIGCHFDISPESWQGFKVADSDKIVIPKDIAIHLTVLVIGTLRGVLHAKTENSDFNRFIFPPFNVTSLVPDDVMFD